jgi:hypothetical protein
LKTERFQCQRSKRGKKPIRFRVVVGHNMVEKAEASIVVPADNPTDMATPPMERAMKERAAAKLKQCERRIMAAAVRARLMKAQKFMVFDKMKKDDDIVIKTVEAFNMQLTIHLRDTLVDMGKLLALEAQWRLGEEQQMKAEEARQHLNLVPFSIQ